MPVIPGHRFSRSLLAGMLLLAGVACSDLTKNTDTPVLIDVFPPSRSGISGQVEVGDTAVFGARALNQKGDSVAATFIWQTADTATVFLDSITGRVAGKVPGTARVQARTGSLFSDLVTVTVVPAADTLVIVPPDSARLAPADTSSAPLVSEIDTTNPTGPLAGRRIIYEIVQFFPATDTVSLNGGLLSLGVTTGASGQPASTVYVRALPGQDRPDSVFVEIRSYRPSGALIPGSGQHFIVRFDP